MGTTRERRKFDRALARLLGDKPSDSTTGGSLLHDISMPRRAGYLREIEFVFFLMAAASMVAVMMSNNSYPWIFWCFVILVDLATGTYALDVIRNSGRERHRFVIAILILAFGTSFTIVTVFLPAHLRINPFYIPYRYEKGSDVYGLPWNEGATDLRVDVTNTSNIDYYDLDLDVTTDLMITAVKEVPPTSGGFKAEAVRKGIPDSPVMPLDANNPGGFWKPMQITGGYLAKTYNIRYAKLAHKTTLHIMLVLMNTDARNYWGPRAFPKKVNISGHYLAFMRTRGEIYESTNIQDYLQHMLRDNQEITDDDSSLSSLFGKHFILDMLRFQHL